MPPIRLKTAGYYHDLVFAMLQDLWVPYAYGAKLWSVLNDSMGSPGGDYLAPWRSALRDVRNRGARPSQDR